LFFFFIASKEMTMSKKISIISSVH
jgi:hypothetical protein